MRTSQGVRPHEMPVALWAIAMCAPNFSACVKARPASSWPEMPVGKPR